MKLVRKRNRTQPRRRSEWEGKPTYLHGYFLGQEREHEIAGRGTYRVGQYIYDPRNQLLRGVVEIVKPYARNDFLDEVWIYKPWLDG